jgi:translation elongation factor EF-G
VDFSPETERTLTLLDYAILVISAAEGVQNHTRTLWQLLDYYGVPTFIFVNKTDLAIKRKEEMESDLQKALSPHCVGMPEAQTRAELEEKLTYASEELMEAVLAGETIEDEEIARLISRRRLFPILFGAALRMEGVSHLLHTLDLYTLPPAYDDTAAFAAKVYKIARAGNTRLTYIKITAGTLTPRDEITYLSADGNPVTEKVSQLRLYSGDKFTQVDSAEAGEICAVIGLSETFAGLGLGGESNLEKPLLEPVLSYCITLPEGCDARLYYPKLKELEEEEPSLHLSWNGETREISARLMGEVQTDLLVRLIQDRLNVTCELGAGRILYKEKIAGKTLGVGHFEPLRHYAEVQLLMEPQPAGTGLVFDTHLPENVLDLN